MHATRMQIGLFTWIEQTQRPDTRLVIHPHDEINLFQRGRVAIFLPQLCMRASDDALSPRIRRGIFQRMEKYLSRMLHTRNRQQIRRQREKAWILQPLFVVAERAALAAAQMQAPHHLAAGTQLHFKIAAPG